MSIASYLKGVKQQFTGHISEIKQLTIVTGNQSSDMDSCVSAISYAFNSTKSVNATHDNSGPIIPLINIPPEDLHLRKDIVAALDGIGVTADDLVFVTQLKDLPKEIHLDLVLVDHNNPEGVYETSVVETYKPHVVGIIDHHADEGLYKDADPRIIEPCGSCSALVLTHFKDVITEKKLSEDDVKFLLSAILLDTSDMTALVEEADTKCYQRAQQWYPDLTDKKLKKYYKLLHKERTNIEGFTFRDIIRKDYKEYECNKLMTGISSAKGPFSKLVDLYGAETINTEINKWRVERKLDVATMMASYRDDNHVHRRELLFCGDPTTPLVAATVAALTDPLQLTPTAGVDLGKGIEVYEQGNDSASRKGVAPLLTNYLITI